MINSRFRINRKLGSGRSIVYHCTDLKLQENYALKVLPPSLSEEEYKKFYQEFFTIQKLNHPGIIKAFEYGTVFESGYDEIPEGSRYILLELIEGKELSEITDLKESDLREILIQITSALQYLHISNFIYYDLKPENILVFFKGNTPEIKIIDIGFVKSLNDRADKHTRGTAEYIAPELLKNEPYDHRVDYYSLGMLLYKVIYNAFPFDNSSEIKIYKAQLEENFKFPPNRFSPEINTVMQKLLRKEPDERYMNAVQIYKAIGYSPAPEIIASWIPAKKFSGRRDIINILNNYLKNYSGGDVFIIKGSEGSGKTALLNEFGEHNPGTVLLNDAKNRYGIDFLKDFLERVFYNQEIYYCVDDKLRIRIKEFLKGHHGNMIEEMKGIFSQLIRSCRFIVLVDDFNFLDELSLQLFRELLPLFQVNNIKVILTENSDKPQLSDFIHNQHQLNLPPFTEVQVSDYLENSFYNYFPQEELKKLILQYADLLPGSIEAIIKDFVLFGIIKFTYDSIQIDTTPESINILKHSHEYFYNLRRERLNAEELLVSEYLSTFENVPDKHLLNELLRREKLDPEITLMNLSNKNIIHFTGNLNQLSFTSAGMKEHIYFLIADKKCYHLRNASLVENYSPGNKKEIAFQYEAAGDFEKSLKYYMQLYEEGAQIDAYTYQKKILEHILEFPLTGENRNDLKYKLCRVLQKSGDSASALEYCNELLLYVSDPVLLNELLILKGICLIGCGELEEGIKQIEHLVEILEDEERKQVLEAEIASAYLDLNKFSDTERICREILRKNSSDDETLGKCWNLLGLVSIHRENNFDEAYEYFQSAEKIYSSGGLKFRTAQMQMNLGNIRNIKGESGEAEALWKRSFELNSSMGNLQHEATLLLNFGVLNFIKLDYEKSIENYKRALSIFSHTGDLKGEGLANYNLGEIYYLSCDYKNALRSLLQARFIFEKIQDTNEEIETLFLLGKFYYTMGSTEDLRKILEETERLLRRDSGEKHRYNYRYLKLLLHQGNLNFFHEIKDIIAYYKRQEDNSNYFRAAMTAVQFLYDNHLYKEAQEELGDKLLSEVKDDNNYYNAEWNLMCGLVTEESSDEDAHPPSEYYLRAYTLIEHLSISELTWKIMSVLAGFYMKRGNFLRAEEFAYYTQTLLDHIREDIDDHSLKNFYFRRKEIKTALDLCSKILSEHG